MGQAQKAENKTYTEKQKLSFYRKRAKDSSLTDGQRKFALNRLFTLSNGAEG